MVYQYKLPYKALKCCNPHCRNLTSYGDYFCSESCYNTVRVAQLTDALYNGEGKAIRFTIFIACLAILATACA